MTAFRSFIINETLKVSHADRYLGYMDKYHNQVFLDLRRELEKEWAKAVDELVKHHPLDDESAQAAIFKNPKATVIVQFVPSIEKITTSRANGQVEVAPSVKIPLSFSKEHRELFIGRLLVAAERAFKNTVEEWREVFKYEKSGRLEPWFKLSRDRDEVRFQLSTNRDDQEAYKTLYAVRLEHGKPSSKLRDHDRLYLINLT